MTKLDSLKLFIGIAILPLFVTFATWVFTLFAFNIFEVTGNPNFIMAEILFVVLSLAITASQQED
jgi:hypothetical protein